MWKLQGRAARATRHRRWRIGRGRWARAIILCALLVGCGLLAVPVHGERNQAGDLIVYLRGGVSPRTLPRDHSTPVSVRLQAGIRTANLVPLPRVTRISLELAYRGALDTNGLPRCAR